MQFFLQKSNNFYQKIKCALFYLTGISENIIMQLFLREQKWTNFFQTEEVFFSPNFNGKKVSPSKKKHFLFTDFLWFFCTKRHLFRVIWGHLCVLPTLQKKHEGKEIEGIKETFFLYALFYPPCSYLTFILFSFSSYIFFSGLKIVSKALFFSWKRYFMSSGTIKMC